MIRTPVLCWLRSFLLMLSAVMPAQAIAALPIQTWTTGNGVPVYFVQADAIPIVDVKLMFDAGNRLDPAGLEGLASLTGLMLDRGAGSLDETGMADAFARIGARRSTGAGTERASLSLRSLAQADKLDRALELLTSMVTAPRLDAVVLAREKARYLQGLKQALIEPDSIARRRFDELLYPQHPYGRNATPASLDAIDINQVDAFYRSRYVAANASIAMVGAISVSRAHAIAELLVSALPAGQAAPLTPVVPEAGPGSEVRIAHSVSQSHILIGTPIIAFGDPDYFALYVGNYVLGGGGFVSRLYKEIRERRGLAYSVYSYFLPMRAAGPFMLGLQTRKSQTDEALAVVRATLADFLAKGPDEDELAAAKAHLSGGFALKLDSNAKILGQIANLAYYRLPLDWLEHWPARVEAVTLAQVRDAFSRRLVAQRLQTVVVGAPSPSDEPPAGQQQ